jgi:hypothetical protein
VFGLSRRQRRSDQRRRFCARQVLTVRTDEDLTRVLATGRPAAGCRASPCCTGRSARDRGLHPSGFDAATEA